MQLHILSGQPFDHEASEVEYAIDLNSVLCAADFGALEMLSDHFNLAFPPLSLGRLIQLPSFIEDCHQDLMRDGFAAFCCQLKRSR